MVDALSPFLNREHVYNIETFSEAGFETDTKDHHERFQHKSIGRGFAKIYWSTKRTFLQLVVPIEGMNRAELQKMGLARTSTGNGFKNAQTMIATVCLVIFWRGLTSRRTASCISEAAFPRASSKTGRSS